MTNLIHLTRFGTSFSAEFQLCPCSFNSDSVSLRQVLLGRPLPLLPCGFHLRACLVMLFGGFFSVWPIHVHFLFLICVFMGSCFFLCQRSSFLTLSNHRGELRCFINLVIGCHGFSSLFTISLSLKFVFENHSMLTHLSQVKWLFLYVPVIKT